ncbi:unnamed protein product [Citrullus colocynthis]|uniref:Uncharacterized protein n=1 Tax=Citrullus colocynthis TaxID=252529 RepID=A0ABP0Z2Z0_9ROSI
MKVISALTVKLHCVGRSPSRCSRVQKVETTLGNLSISQMKKPVMMLLLKEQYTLLKRAFYNEQRRIGDNFSGYNEYILFGFSVSLCFVLFHLFQCYCLCLCLFLSVSSLHD